jgi:hypothetical protein
MPVTPEVVTHLQVCVSSVEFLAGMRLPAEAHQALARLSRAVDALVSATTAASRPADTIEDRLSPVGSRAERG